MRQVLPVPRALRRRPMVGMPGPVGYGRPRDNQRSRVYAWERRASAGAIYRATMPTMDEVSAFLLPIWRTERGRYGMARHRPPELTHARWGQRRALAYDHHLIALPLWARNPWVALHELAHRLTPDDEAHGPRFVGVLIGLLARHAGYDAQDLLESAEASGVRVYRRAIGAVPQREPATLGERLLPLLPASDMDLACELGVHWREVRGASLGLIRSGRARWLRGKLVLLERVERSAS